VPSLVGAVLLSLPLVPLWSRQQAVLLCLLPALSGLPVSSSQLPERLLFLQLAVLLYRRLGSSCYPRRAPLWSRQQAVFLAHGPVAKAAEPHLHLPAALSGREQRGALSRE
jgi:hypothetical protein